MGTASMYLVVRSTIENRLEHSIKVGRGPTQSTWMWENLLVGMGMGWVGVWMCWRTLAL